MPRQKRSNEICLDDALNNIYIDSPRKRGRMEKHSPKPRTRSMPSSQIKKGYVSTTGPANDSNLLEPPAFLESLQEPHIMPMKSKVKKFR